MHISPREEPDISMAIQSNMDATHLRIVVLGVLCLIDQFKVGE